MLLRVSNELLVGSVKIQLERKIRRQNLDLAVDMGGPACHRAVHPDFRGVPAVCGYSLVQASVAV